MHSVLNAVRVVAGAEERGALLMVPASVFCFGANLKSSNEELVKKKDH